MEMDPKFQSSFIPKAPVVGNNVVEKKETTSFFGIFAMFVFSVALLALGGAFAFKKITESSIRDLETELAEAEASVDKPSIDNLIAFDKRIKAMKEIIYSHVAVSGYLAMLEDSTVSNVEFKTLKYSTPDSRGNITITMDGRAGSYGAVAEEEYVLAQNPDTVSLNFDNLSLDKSSGGVSFIFKGEFKNNLVKFRTASTTP
jgi:hypothetical protein